MDFWCKYWVSNGFNNNFTRIILFSSLRGPVNFDDVPASWTNLWIQAVILRSLLYDENLARKSGSWLFWVKQHCVWRGYKSSLVANLVSIWISEGFISWWSHVGPNHQLSQCSNCSGWCPPDFVFLVCDANLTKLSNDKFC